MVPSWNYLYSSPDIDEVDYPAVATDSLRRQLHSHTSRSPPSPPSHQLQEEKKPDREVALKLSVTETDFVVVEDVTSLNSNAVVLKVSQEVVTLV